MNTWRQGEGAMEMPTVFLVQSGSWFQDNAGLIITVVLQLLALVIWAVRLEGRVKNVSERVVENCEDIEDLNKDMRQHTADSDRHVNHLHMRAVEHRLDSVDTRMDKFETTMQNGFDKTMSKIDALAAKIHGN